MSGSDLVTISVNLGGYSYEPLPDPKEWLRIIELLPGSGTDPIQCKLSAKRIDDAEDTYEAISYVWGDPRNTCEIVCDGKCLKVTPNLKMALWYFRDEIRSRYIWADAVCINQGDDQEKGPQVQRMGTIYVNAKRVLIWLGEEDHERSKAAFELIESMIRESNASIRQEALITGELRFGRDEPDMDDLWKPFNKIKEQERALMNWFFDRPWFSRLWILQEAGMAKTARLYSRHTSISLSKVISSAFGLVNQADGTSTLSRISCIRNIVLRYTDKPNWRREEVISWSYREGLTEVQSKGGAAFILSHAARYGARDPRDYVYALYGHQWMATLAEKIPVDYTISREELYYRTAVALIQDPKVSWRVLCFSHLQPQTLQSSGKHCPSWVPMWDMPQQDLPPHKPNYTTGGEPGQFEAYVHPNGWLKTRGFIIDRIRSSTKASWTNSFQNMMSDVVQGLGLHGGTVTMDQMYSLLFTLSAGHETAAFDTILDYFTVGSNGLTEEDRMKIIRYMYFARITLSSNTTLFTTESIYVGQGANVLRDGDVCCIFPGADMPFVLRETEEPGQYILVCACYIGGLMGGQAMEMLKDGEYTLQDITII